MIYNVRHRTTYEYGGVVTRSDHRMWLEPRDTPHQTVHHSKITTGPVTGKLTEEKDYFGNTAHLMSMDDAHEMMWVEAKSRVEVRPAPDQIGFDTMAMVKEAVARPQTTEAVEAAEFTFPTYFTTPDEGILAYAQEVFQPDRPLMDASMAMTSRIFEEFEYNPVATDAATTGIQAFGVKKGVCQDFAHVFLACARSVGVPARYVSGYLLTRPPEGQQKMIGSDASHAWVAVWTPHSGWVDFDPTNDMIPRDEHITTAWGRDFADVSPIRGIVLGGGGHGIKVAVDVIPED